MMAKKMERKNRKAQESSKSVASVEKPIEVELVENVEEACDTDNTRELIPEETTEVSEEAPHDEVAECGDWNAEKATDSVESTEGSCDLPCNVNLDDIESDTDSEAGEATYIFKQDCPAEPEMQNAPVLWCSVPHSPTSVEDCNSPYAAMMPQMEGWMAVAVPAECAPNGAFDGLWQNAAEEKILIEKLEIMFESGVTWNMTMHSLTNISVTIEGQEYTAERDGVGANLRWSDGDVWTFFGTAEPEEQPEQQVVATVEELPHEIPSMMWEDPSFVPMISPLDEYNNQMIMAPMPNNNQMIPQDAEKWELCWDYQKKGFCPRGAACDWYHPAPELPMWSTCGTCEDASYSWPLMA
jgi:hypothetical protein